MTAESISLIIGIVSALLGLITFFAAIIFYTNGNRLNRLSEKILSNIDSKVNLIQDHYGKVVDRSLGLTEGNVESLSKQVLCQLNILDNSLKEAIRMRFISFQADEPNQTHKELIPYEIIQKNIEMIIDEKLSIAKQNTENIITISGNQYRSHYIKWRFLKALQYGSGTIDTVRRYFKSYCIETMDHDIYLIASKLEKEGLIEIDSEFTEQAKMANSNISEPYWRLTEYGINTLSNHRS